MCKEEENLLFRINASQVLTQVPQKLYSFNKTQGYRNEWGHGDLFPPNFGRIYFLPDLNLDLTLKNSPNFMNLNLCPQQSFRASGSPAR